MDSPLTDEMAQQKARTKLLAEISKLSARTEDSRSVLHYHKEDVDSLMAKATALAPSSLDLGDATFASLAASAASLNDFDAEATKLMQRANDTTELTRLLVLEHR